MQSSHLPLKIVECPRDAMQGWPHLISTEKKVDYISSLLRIGFDTIDFGSFVSSKAIPQMADTNDVLDQLDLSETKSQLLAIVANLKGAEQACSFEQIAILGFPFSISPRFSFLNTNTTMQQSIERVDAIQSLCKKHNKQLVIYLSMGFGNPYGDAYSEDILLYWAEEMVNKGISIISLADTVGLAEPKDIAFALNTLIPKYPEVTFGVHLHSTSRNMEEKLKAAFDNGCRRFDSALKGIGGCPMAQNELVGNMDTEKMIQFFESKGELINIDKNALLLSREKADKIFI